MALPARRTEIRHCSTDRLPDPREDYRCHVCRLDLRFDSAMQKMVVAPFDARHQAIDERLMTVQGAAHPKQRP